MWQGGESETTLRRVAAFGDGWITHPNRLPTIREDWARVREQAAALGRDANALTLATTGTTLLEGERLEKSAERLHGVREAGVQHAILGVHPRELASAPAVLERFAARYLTAVREG